MQKNLWASLPLLWLMFAACSAEMPAPVPDGTASTPSHKRYTLEQAQQHLNSMWGKLPRSSTRANEGDSSPVPDSAFNIPSGEFAGTFDPGTEAWVLPQDVECVDTVDNYAYAMTFQDGGFAIMSATDEMPNLLFGSYPDDDSNEVYCRKVLMIYGVRK